MPIDIFPAVVAFLRDNGLGTLIVVFAGWFLASRLFPWYTNAYLPLLVQRQDYRDHIIADLRDAVIELKTLTAQLVATIQQHDINTRDLILKLGSNQQAILDLLSQPVDEPIN